MTLEDCLLFACTRQEFDEAHRHIVEKLCQGSLQWKVIYDAADAHAVAPLIYTNLQKCEARLVRMPPEISERFEVETYRNLIAKEEIARRTEQVLAYLNQQHVEVMLLKGAALDVLVYKEPWYTTANDVDLMLRSRPDNAEVREFLKTLDASEDIQFEYDCGGHHDVSINGLLPINFAKMWRDAVRIRYRAVEVAVMAPEDMLIASCINSSRRKFFRLKAICDIAEIIRTQQSLNWRDLAEKAREYQAHNIVYAALYATQATVGCEIDGSMYELLNVNPAKAWVIRSLCNRMSYSSLPSLFSGTPFLHRTMSLALLIPYAAYTPQQILKKVRYVWSNR